MTNKRASEILYDQWQNFLDKNLDYGGISEAYKKAFEALEQEPCEDYISRKALTDTTICEGISCNECSFNTCEDGQSGCLLKERIDKLPPVTPHESKTVLYSGDGYADGYMVYDMAECPNCGYEYEEGDKDWGLPFCPNCGQSLNWESEVEE